MQTYVIVVIVTIVAYLLGSIPFGYILVRLFKKQDIRQTGSGNIGATNVARSGAKGLGIATLILDAAKGFIAVYLAAIVFFWLYPPTFQGLSEGIYLAMAIAAVSAVTGHIFPIWLKFKGGKGVATGVGVFLALAPKAVGLVLLIFLVVVRLSRYVSLGSIIATAAFPVLAWLLYKGTMPGVVFVAAAVAALLIIARHHQNIRRLLAGTEHRLGEKKQTEVRA